jgi:hypothetical protein
MPMCPIHQKEMRQNSRGWYCPTRVGEGWCSYKPGKQAAPRVSATPGANAGFQKTPSDWERKVGKQKALCGMVNGLFAGGMKPQEITAEVVLKLNGILNQIETASGVPASPAPRAAVPKPAVQAAPQAAPNEEPPVEAYGEPLPNDEYASEINVEDVPF